MTLPRWHFLKASQAMAQNPERKAAKGDRQSRLHGDPPLAGL